MKAVLIGYGEVGKGLHEVLAPYHKIDIQDPPAGYGVKGKYEIMLVAIPYSDQFVCQIKAYQLKYKPVCTIIFSTVPIGTSTVLGAVHSPIEGNHPDLANSIRAHTRWIGGRSSRATSFLLEAMLKLKVVNSPEFTEFMKLRSLALYAVNIEFSRYTKGISDGMCLDYSHIHSYDRDYNDLNQTIKKPQFSRYILYPPKGRIGGHCVLPGVKMLQEQFPDIFLETVLERNNKSEGVK